LLRGKKQINLQAFHGVNKNEEKIEKEMLKSPKHSLYFQTKIKFVKGPPPKQWHAQKIIKTKTFLRPKHKKPF